MSRKRDETCSGAPQQSICFDFRLPPRCSPDLCSSGVLRGIYSDTWPVKMGPIRYPETSVNNHHTTPRNIPEERISQSICWLDPVQHWQHLYQVRLHRHTACVMGPWMSTGLGLQLLTCDSSYPTNSPTISVQFVRRCLSWAPHFHYCHREFTWCNVWSQFPNLCTSPTRERTCACAQHSCAPSTHRAVRVH